MSTQSTKPVVFLAFANSSAYPLPSLATECNQLTAILEAAAKKGLCELVVRPYATVDQILSTFEQADLRGRLAVFHYAGHANSYELLLEGPDGDIALAHAGGLTAFLRHQRGLQLIFLNACSTQGQVQGLLDAGVNVVLATSQDINDQIATAFANHFYTFLVNLDTIEIAFAKAQAAVHTRHGGDTRHLYSPNTPVTTTTNGWPWDLYQRPDAIAASRWTLGDAATTRLLPFEPETVLIPAGPFLMGSMPGPGVAQHETPQHTVVLPAYRIGKYPVTNRQYAEFLKQMRTQEVPKHRGWFLREPPSSRLDHPVVAISWYDAWAYCVWLSKITGRTYRLPSEAEWEKAARGCEGWRFPWGDIWADGCANINGNETTSVDAYLAGASPYGCVDMIGNVQEWTSTLWGSQLDIPDVPYPQHLYDSETDTAHELLHQARLVQRGGSFRPTLDEVRSAARGHAHPSSKIAWRGFRVAMTLYKGG
jgi:formylglycine-generating enzyme required for sulfatase activity